MADEQQYGYGQGQGGYGQRNPYQQVAQQNNPYAQQPNPYAQEPPSYGGGGGYSDNPAPYQSSTFSGLNAKCVRSDTAKANALLN